MFAKSKAAFTNSEIDDTKEECSLTYLQSIYQAEIDNPNMVMEENGLNTFSRKTPHNYGPFQECQGPKELPQLKSHDLIINFKRRFGSIWKD